jgi:hypothetical protein
VGDENMMDAGVWEIGEIQGVNCAVNFRLERNVRKGLMKEPTRSGLKRTLRERGKVRLSASIGISGCGLLKG